MTNPSVILSELAFSRKNQKPRMTSNITVIHQLPGEDAQSFSFTGLQETFETDEKPYDRTITIGETPVVLDFGWIGPFSKVSYVMFHNVRTVGKANNPTPEELEAANAAVIEIVECRLLVNSGVVVPPIRVMAEQITVRCQKGTARLRYIGIPK